MENIEIGLLLMVVGMTTVFAILLLVIFLGKGLIAFVNKYVPEEIIIKKQPQPQIQTVNQTAVSINQPVEAIHGSTTAAIVSAISIITGGKGKVTKIEKQ